MSAFHGAAALVAWAAALRVFAGDVRAGVRHLLSLGVRVGSAELLREHTATGQTERRPSAGGLGERR